MAAQRSHFNVPRAVEHYLAERTDALRRGETRGVRLMPLVLKSSVIELLRRRRGLFLDCRWEQTDFGFIVEFSRKLKPGPGKADGKTVSGTFEMLCISSDLCILASSLGRINHNQGPRRLCEQAYPIAKRPFLTSRHLCCLIENITSKNNWGATALDTMGYDRQTLKFRRDMKRQPVEDAFAEMSEQKRQVHQLKVLFADENNREELTASFNRYADSTLYRGSATKLCKEFNFPATAEAISQADAYDVKRVTCPSDQESLQIVFTDEIFTGRDEMNELCQALRRGDGLSVTTIHLNPYLQAQVLDFFSGEAVELLVLDSHTISLIPRSGRCQSALARITESIFYSFGDATVQREMVTSA